jgi:hypothetical protein
MDHSQVLIKTTKGQEEIRTKAFKLSARLRRLLIMVDGHSTVGATLNRLSSLGDETAALLDSLVANGFLAPRNAPPPGTASPGGAAFSPQAEFNLEKAKGFARYVVLGSLGPVGARRVERIDAATSPGELRAELDDLREILPKLLPKRQAKEVWDQLEPLMLSMS